MHAPIRDLVRELIQHYHTRDPFQLVENILGHPPTSASGLGENKGFYLKRFGLNLIVYNDTLPERIQTIVVAHELAHLVLHEDEPLPCGMRPKLATLLLDSEANSFAADLLLPDEDVVEALETYETIRRAACALSIPEALLFLKIKLMIADGLDLPDPGNDWPRMDCLLTIPMPEEEWTE